MSILGIGKNRRTQRKLDAIKRKMEKIEEMEKTLEEPSEMTGQGFNPVKDYHRGTLLASIKRKQEAIKRKKGKI